MTPEIMARRGELLHLLRDFFFQKGYLEVDTPLLSPRIIPETTIEIFSSTMKTPYGTEQELYLLPSPEYYHKLLIADGMRRHFYQLSKVFRNSEQTGLHHNIEFTMLEWYSLGSDYRSSMGFAKELLQHCARHLLGEHLSFSAMRVSDACRSFAGLDLDALQNPSLLREEAMRRGHRIPPDETWNDTFQRLFVSEVEPQLPAENPVFLLDYPVQIPCLAKTSPDGRYRERWELYWKGMELANCYTEETDAAAVKAFMEQEGAGKDRCALVKARWDEEFWKRFSHGYPAVSGAALGFDRLLMALLDIRDIAQAVYFPFRR
ncbi:MAG: elongation factor P--(R)-beta-lysine ligase [Spirochaetales bacterium]|nr:elongation factor P--(R)-beta-lysine ligase [Spirochaetales bacterium]